MLPEPDEMCLYHKQLPETVSDMYLNAHEQEEFYLRPFSPEYKKVHPSLNKNGALIQSS